MDTATKKASQSIIVALIASVPVLFRGLFFNQDYLVFALFAFLWIAVCVTLSNVQLRIDNMLDMALGGLVCAYILAAFVAVNSYTAIFEALKYILFYFIYLTAKDVFKKTEHISRFFTITTYALVLNALISLLTASGVLNFPAAYSDSEIEKWLNGTVQYHNAFGALMLAGYFIANAQNSNAIKSLRFAANGICSYFLMFGLIMSYSRGAWILVPVLFILFMIFAAPQEKIRFFGTGFASLLSVIAVLSSFAACVDAKNTAGALLWLLGGLLISLFLYYIFHLLLEKFSSKPHFKTIGICCIAALILLAVAVLLFPSAFPFLPERLTERLAGIDFSTNTVQERFVFYGDAFRLYKDHNLILGSGGGAWQYLYGMYQSYLYFSTQAHSYIMQILVETGALGFLFWLASIVLFYIQCFKAKNAGKIGKDLLCAICCAGSTLILHSFIDFDLSIPAILLALWCLLGVLSGNTPSVFGTAALTLNKWAVCVICVLFSIGTFLGWIGYTNYEQANLLLQEEQNYGNAYKSFETAARVMPLNAEYQSAYLLAAAANNQPVSEEEMQQTIARDKYNTAVYENAFYFYDAAGDYVKALDCVNKLIELQPLISEHYISLANVSSAAVQQYMNQLDFKNAAQLANSVLEKKDKMLEAAEEISINKKSVENTIEYLETIRTTLEGI